MSNYQIRELRDTEVSILEEMLYEAIFQPDESKLLPKEIIKQPEISVYINNWGYEDDFCLVAESGGKIVGAVWTRILDGEIKGFGNIDSKTPEFAISLFKEYRNQGIGTALMGRMIEKLRNQGYSRTSLSVAKENYAVKMYKKVGFKILKENEEDYIMVLILNS